MTRHVARNNHTVHERGDINNWLFLASRDARHRYFSNYTDFSSIVLHAKYCKISSKYRSHFIFLTGSSKHAHARACAHLAEAEEPKAQLSL